MTDLARLLGRYVRVTNPDLPDASWEGVLQGLADMPSLILDMPDGHRAVLPQRFTVEEIPAGTQRSEAEIRAQALREASAVARGRGYEEFARYLAAVAEEIDPVPLAGAPVRGDADA